jgi:hypothetical protein
MAEASTEQTYKVALGPILTQKIPYHDPYWPTFNASFVNEELTQIQIAAALYEGRPITTWQKNNWRHSRNYIAGQHLGIDFDTMDKRSTLDTLRADSFIAHHAAILYTTPSHTPATPRSRALFLLDTPIQQAKNYALAAAALLWVFGAADRQCKDPARFFYGGKPGACEMDWLNNELSLNLVKDLIRRYQETGAQQQRRLARKYEGVTPDEKKVSDALHHIDAWGIEYDEWLSVLMAIHSAFPGMNGEQMAEAWAQGKEGEVTQKWRSFKADGNVSGRVGIGTLFALAQSHGWEAPREQ